MTKVITFICGVALLPAVVLAQTPRPVDVKDIVDIEMLTHSEIYDKIHKEGKTTVIIANGGTEQRGPHVVLGGHTIMAHHKAIEIARKLTNALVAPSSPFAASASGLSEATPGGVALPAEVFKTVNVAEIESMVINGFKNIFIMGDHGGGQNEMKQVAEEEDKKLSAKGVHVYYISDFYSKSHDDFDEYSYEHNIPIGSHAGVPDTSEMMYWEPSPGTFVRPIYKTVPFNPGPTAEEWKAQQEARKNGTPQRGQRPANPNRVANGITGDPHMSSKELGKIAADISINNAVAEIKKLMAEKRAGN